jgi:hypothetical protein
MKDEWASPGARVPQEEVLSEEYDLLISFRSLRREAMR